MGARIGCGVILSNINCLTDPHLVTIGDHVRLNMGVHIQVRYDSVVHSSIFIFYLKCHTFERRLFKLAPITVHRASVLLNGTLVLAGSILHGQNRILPLTLVMKEEQLPPDTNWSGVPAKLVV